MDIYTLTKPVDKSLLLIDLAADYHKNSKNHAYDSSEYLNLFYIYDVKRHLENEIISDIKKHIKKHPLFYTNALIEELAINKFSITDVEKNKFTLRYFEKDGLLAKHLYKKYATKELSNVHPLIIEKQDIFMIIDINPCLSSKKPTIDTKINVTEEEYKSLQIINIKEKINFFFKHKYEQEELSEILLETLLYNKAYPLKKINNYYYKKLIKMRLQDKNEDGVTLQDLKEFEHIYVYQILNESVYNDIKKRYNIADVMVSTKKHKETKGRLIITCVKLPLG